LFVPEDDRRTQGLGDLLRSRRLERFVGRTAEIEIFQTALDSAADGPFSVLYIHGPGGIGKSSLLDVLAARAGQQLALVVRLDGRDLPLSAEAFQDALRGSLDVPEGAGPITSRAGRIVLLIDAYEQLTPLDDWLRTRLMPRLPRTTLTVIAGRGAPSASWRADAAWRDLLRVVSLRNLSSEESREYLRRCGIAEQSTDRLIALAHGHPLGLSLLVDMARDGGPDVEPPPDLVSALLRQFLDVVPDLQQRRALEACALARVTTEALLRDALELDDANHLFTWLRGLSFVEARADGLFPHELARDVLDIDLRWRDPDAYKRTFRRVRAHIHRNLESAQGQAQQRAIYDEKFVFRNLPSVLSPVDWSAWGERYPEPAHAADRAAIIDVVARYEGPESADIAAHWFDRQRDGFVVLREPDGALRGFLALLDLTAASAADRAADPGARAAWEHANTPDPIRPGEIVTQTRFVIDSLAYGAPSPTLNATPVVTIQRYLRTPSLAFDFLTLADPDQWNDYFALADFPRVDGADFTVGDRRYGLFRHDFRAVPLGALLELWTERALSQDVTPPRTGAPEVLVLSYTDFIDAVRRALHDLHRADLLARNPLLRTRLLRERTGSTEPKAADLDAMLRDAVSTLRQHPRDDKLLRAIDRTYLRPAATQEAAAAALGLPFSTYRRHLSQGLARIVTWCWERELHGVSDEHT
jgi:AAA ATPase domain